MTSSAFRFKPVCAYSKDPEPGWWVVPCRRPHPWQAPRDGIRAPPLLLHSTHNIESLLSPLGRHLDGSTVDQPRKAQQLRRWICTCLGAVGCVVLTDGCRCHRLELAPIDAPKVVGEVCMIRTTQLKIHTKRGRFAQRVATRVRQAGSDAVSVGVSLGAASERQWCSALSFCFNR